MKINKQVIKDYFGSFFKQYSPISKENFAKIRDIVDEAECGCCSPTTFYWLEIGDNQAADPANQQIIFKDQYDNVLVETALTGNPQTFCIPREASQICLNIINQANDGGTINVFGNNTFLIEDDEVGEVCDTLNTPVSPFFTIQVVPAPVAP